MDTDELAVKNAWNSILWFLKYVCAPFAVPFVILRLIRKFTPKESLQGKVVTNFNNFYYLISSCITDMISKI